MCTTEGQEKETMTMFIPGESLRVGDMVRYLEPYPWVRVVAIRQYDGPLNGIVRALVDTKPGIGFSICFGDEVEVDRS